MSTASLILLQGIIFSIGYPAVLIRIAASYERNPAVTTRSTFSNFSKSISQIQETSFPSGTLSFKTNNNSFGLGSLFKNLKLTLTPVGFLAKLMVVLQSFTSNFSNLPLFNTNFSTVCLTDSSGI